MFAASLWLSSHLTTTWGFAELFWPQILRGLAEAGKQRSFGKRSVQPKSINQRRYLEAIEKGLVLGKGKRPKKSSTLCTDHGRIERHILPLLGSRRVRDLTPSDVVRFK